MNLPVGCCCCIQITPAKNGKPVQIELIDTKTKETKDVLEVLVLILMDKSPNCLMFPQQALNV